MRQRSDGMKDFLITLRYYDKVQKRFIDLFNYLKKGTKMKKVLFSLFAAWSLLIGSAVIAKAGSNNENFTVRFRENTLVVSSNLMTEARVYNKENGKLLAKSEGNWAEFELEQGEYRLYAKVNGETVARTVILK